MAVAVHDKWSRLGVQLRPLQAELYSVRHVCFAICDQKIAFLLPTTTQLQFREQVVETSKLSG